MIKRVSALLLVLLFLPCAGFTESIAPSLASLLQPVIPGDAVLLSFTVPEACEVSLTVTDADGMLLAPVVEVYEAAAGENRLYWNGTWQGNDLPQGTWQLCLTAGTAQAVTPVTVGRRAPEQSAFTPSFGSPYAADGSLSYWNLPMDITNEAAVWEVLMQPVTVLDRGSGYSEKSQVVIRSAPDANSEGVGVVTCITQGVRVLEKGETWSLIECYSSSFHDSPISNWNTLVQGYVLTKYLRQTEPSWEYGIVVDKLTQRLYLFKEGHLYTTLLVSTGLANASQPYNETRSGEFLLTSAVGTFPSDNLKCAYAIRFNDGDLLHEVPYTLMRDGKSKDYTRCEAKLGVKASHGCIRVQRKKSPEGVNMYWLWENRHKNTKLLIWEDWQGRQIPCPEDSLTLYYQENGDHCYHASDRCAALADTDRKPVTAFTWGELETEPYAELERCNWCAPVLRRGEIDAVNEVYAWGGDHDPVLTKARLSCPKKLK